MSILKIKWPTKVMIELAIILAICISVLDIFGLLEILLGNNEKILPSILLLLALFIIFEMEYHKKTKKCINDTKDDILKLKSDIKDSKTDLENAISALQWGVQYFENMAALYDHMADKLAVAKGINDVTWGYPSFYTKIERIAYDNYLNTKEQVCKKDDIKYREVSSLNNQNYLRWSKNLAYKELDGYHLGYYDNRDKRIPMISFMIIDSKEIILYTSQNHERGMYVSISQPMFIHLFKDYFEILWTNSAKIKDGNDLSKEILAEIEKNMETLSPSFIVK